MIRPAARIVRLSLSGLLLETTTGLRLPCAGGGRVLAAEQAILRIAYVVRKPSDGVAEATVLAAEQAILRIAWVVKNPSDGVPEGTVLATEQRHCVSPGR